MCAGAIVLARVRELYSEPGTRRREWLDQLRDLLRHPRLNHVPEVEGGVLSDDCAQMLSEFFNCAE